MDIQGEAPRLNYEQLTGWGEAETIAAPHIVEALQYRPRVDVG